MLRSGGFGGVALAFAFAFSLGACGSREPPLPTSPAIAVARSEVPSASPRVAIRVLVGGDLLPHRPRLLPPSRIAEALAPLRSLFAEADATIANYETATGNPADLTDASRSIALAAPPAWLGEVARAKVTAITAANNHACDLGERGLDATLSTANRLGLVPLGVDEADPWRPRVVAEKDGHRVCAIAWSTFVNEPVTGCVGSGKIAVASYRKRGLAQIDRAIAAARAAGCEAVIAILHGGEEYVSQVQGPLLQAQRAAIAGADAVVIHHPHVPSPVQIVTTPEGRHVPVFASVGNLVSNQGESWKMPLPPSHRDGKSISLNAWTRLGVLADLRWTFAPDAPNAADGKDARPRLDWGYHLVWIENEHALHHDLAMPKIEARLFDPVRDKGLMERLMSDAEGPGVLFSDPCWIESSGKLCL
jgi:poly-gamma-glutamate capsule biosynthesis protein CapA/YwtB (metallophosphatase superfamily)